MSTLDELRETLGRHADALDDTGRPERSAAVRRRVLGVRRRRSVATAIAAAGVVIGGIGVVTSIPVLRGPDVTGPSVVGVGVPKKIEILGFRYVLSGQERVDDEKDRIRLDSSDEQRAVALVGDGLGSGSATLFVDGTAAARVFAGDAISVPVPVHASDQDAVLRVELHDTPADARTGVAVYDATGELPPGVDDGTVVFRDTVADRRLLAADFSEAGGSSSATLRFRAPLTSALIATHCRTDEPGLWLEVLIDGEVTSTGECGEDGHPDAVMGTSFTVDDGEDSDPHTVEARVTRGQNGDVVPDAPAAVGVAAYEQGRTVRVAGMDVDEVVERAGRTWRLDLHDVGATLGTTADTDLLVGFVAEGRGLQATWRGELTRGETGGLTATTGPGSIVDGLLLAGDTYVVELVSDSGPVVSGALLVYRPE